MEFLHEAWHHHHVFTEAEDPLELREASGSEAGKQKQMWQDIWCSRTGLYLTASEPDDGAGGKQSFSGSPASAERLIHWRETQKMGREVTAQKRGRCPRTLLLARLINDMWSHSQQNCGQIIKEGKIPTINYKTDMNRTLGCHEEHRRGENKLTNKMGCW